MWYDLASFEGIYQTNHLGQIRSINGRILKQAISKDGYLIIGLRKNNKRYTFRVHRLIALTFILNPDNKREVNHINGNKSDNRVINLEWVTPKENVIHAHKEGLVSHAVGFTHGKSKAVSQRDLTGKLINVYPCVRLTTKDGFRANSVSVACEKNKLYRGYKWQYI